MTEVEALRAMTYEQRVAALDVAEIGIRMTVDVITEALMVPCDLLLVVDAVEALAEHLDEVIAA